MTNWTNPQLTSTYTNFVTEVKDRDTDLAVQFDGVTVTNIPTNTIRWDSTANRWKKWSGSAWGELATTYALTALTTTGAATFGGNVGAYLVLSGVAGALTPVPSTPEQEQDPRTSFSFSGIQNTSRAGVAVPVIYGETITGSVVISAAIDTVQVEV